MRIATVGVVGCGQMGSGIAQVCVQAGYRTIVAEAKPDLLDRGLARARDGLERAAKRGKLTLADRDAALSRLHGVADLSSFASCDLVIEAIVENLAEKQSLFRRLDPLLSPHAILASNTSSCPIAALAGATKRPDRVVGIHFFNPVPVMPLVELVRPAAASEETVLAARVFSESLGKRVIMAKDAPGFIVNLLLVPFLLDAIRAVEAGTATKEDIDTGLKLGCNHPLGPLELCDFIGLDTVLFIADILRDAYGDPKYAAPALLREMVKQGKLGRKAGGGFHASQIPDVETRMTRGRRP